VVLATEVAAVDRALLLIVVGWLKAGFEKWMA